MKYDLNEANLKQPPAAIRLSAGIYRPRNFYKATFILLN